MRSGFARITTILGYALVLVASLSLPAKGGDGEFCLSPQEVTGHSSILDGLIVYYPFSGNANDASGNGNDGTVYGATLTADRFGNPDSAYSFDGIDDYIQADGSYDFSSQNELAISAWFRLDGHTAHAGIVSSHDCCAYRIMVLQDLRPLYDAGTHEDVIIDEYTFELDEWYHYAMTISDGTAKLFVNGEKIYESSEGVPGTLPSVLNAFIIGSGEKYPEQRWYAQGVIDDVRIYNRALSEAEVQALYDQVYLPLVLK